MPVVKHQPPFPYYGGKAMLAPWIVSHFPDHRAYVEPFFGSGAVLLAKPPSSHEIANDLNGDVVNFWRVLRDQHDDLVEVLQLTPYARDEWRASSQVDSGASDVERARRFFVSCCLAFNAKTSKGAGFSPSGNVQAPKPATFVRRIDGRLSQVAERIRNVEIENVDALRLIDRWRDARTLLYLDPPYMDSTRSSRNDYATDNGGDAFHRALVDRIADFPGTVVLSGYPCELYDELGWREVYRDVAAHTSSTAGARRREMLWINRA